MGKHKKGKSKKSKKSKKEKNHSSKKSHHHSDSSSDEESEVIWAESGSTQVEISGISQQSASSQVKASDDNNSSSSVGEDEVADDEAGDWLGVIQRTSKSNMKLAHLKRDIRKNESEKADNKIRYARELNSYYRDDATKKFIDDPENYWKAKAENNKASELKESYDEKEKEEGDLNEHVKKGPSNKEKAAQRLSNVELNAINAKIIKAEMLGNAELLAELRTKLEQHNNAMAMDSNRKEEEKVEYYVRKKSKQDEKKKQDDMSVKQMFFEQKQSTSSREEAMRFVAASSKIRLADDEYEETAHKKKKTKVFDPGFERLRSNDDAQVCGDCLERTAKHLVFRFGGRELKHCFICFTANEPFTANYCQIRSRSHAVNNSLAADEECWSEIRQIMRLVASFFAKHHNCVVVFMETYFMHKKRAQNLTRRHFVIECVPIKEQLEGDARIYFHKAILESGEEWAMNKKMIKLEEKPITKMLPKGLSYFWVSFGPNFKGFAHVIEDEDYFNRDFGKEIIGGLRDIDPLRWKRPKFQDYNQQMKRIGETRDKWNEFIKSH